MKMGKDEEKVAGPMFPRLHVNDKEKGGPRAPPRNKMALYEPLSIPSQRYNNTTPNNTTNPVHPSSSSQGSGHSRGVSFPLRTPTLTHPTEKSRGHNICNVNASLVQLEQKRLDEEDFRVPVFVHSETDQDPTNYSNNVDGVRFSPFSPAIQGASDKELKEFIANRNLSKTSASNLSAGKSSVGLLKQTTKSINLEHVDQHTSSSNSVENADAIVWSNYTEGSRPENITRDEVLNEPIRVGIGNRNPLVSRRSYDPEENVAPGNAFHNSKHIGGKTHGLLPVGPIDGCNDDSEASVVDQVLGLDMTPDDIVGVIGQKHFWKARREILHQQRVFAVQVFELHRLIEVQKLIAGSPNILLEATANLSKPLKDSPVVKLVPLDYVVKPPPPVFKAKVAVEKPTCSTELSAENAIEKASSVENCSPPPNYRSNPPPTPVMADNNQIPPWYFQQPQGNPWLYPVMSPSEGLIYKPCYPGSGPPMPSPCGGGFGPPPVLPQMVGNYFNQPYPGMGYPSIGHGYFPPYGMQMMSTPMSGHGHHPSQFSGGEAVQQQQQQSSCTTPSQNSRAAAGSNSPKLLETPKGSDVRGSTRSSPCERAQVGTDEAARVMRVVPRNNAGSSVTQSAPSADHDEPTQVIRVVPRNARSATESAARIFQSIQQERKQLEYSL